MSESVTKEQIAAYQKAQAQKFLDAYNALIEETGMVLVPIIRVVDGRLLVDLEVHPK